MNKIFTICLILLTFCAAPAYASESKSYSVPVKDVYGHKMGNVVVYHEDGLLYTDYDFDSPYDCLLQSITTNQGGSSYTFAVISKDGQTLRQYPNTYIAPRDAVLAFDVSGQPYRQSWQFSSTLQFKCDSRYVTAYASKYLSYPTPTYKPYYAPYYTPTLTPMPSPRPTFYNPRTSWGEWDKSHYLWLKSIADKANGR